ncbi:eIF2 kinase Gcn2p negative regulator [Xylographa trunciseda]|nr:eIF2 kinase Gcn2p negative regulator [Xylographa trunciseda]
MSEVDSEILAIKAIYGDDILQSTDREDLYILSIPLHPVALQVQFPPEYPAARPTINGIESTGDAAPKGYGSHVLKLARETLGRVWNSGSVCLYDLIQELDSLLEVQQLSHDKEADSIPAEKLELEDIKPLSLPTPSTSEFVSNSSWVVSAPTAEKKSVFIARACAVSSPIQASAYVSHLLATDKKLAKATHNITAYRIRSSPSSPLDRELVYQDCDDDGETAAGGRLLHLLQAMDVWNVLVMVSRWYGGVKLGPDRFRIISAVAREALVEGGFDQTSKVPKSRKN